MKKIFFIITSVLIFFNSCSTLRTSNSEFSLGAGVNLSHWLSQNFTGFEGPKRYEAMTSADFKAISNNGFDHVRIPIDEQEMWTEDGKPIDYTFGLLDDAIKWSLKNNLKVVVDLHIIRSHHFDEQKSNTLWTDENSQIRFISMWKDLSSHLKKYSTTKVAYEFMNEPVAPDPEDWNKLIDKVIKEIRPLEPQRKFIIGANMWQSVDQFKNLKVPANDKNLILSFHFYEPFMLTHYKASWNKAMQVDKTVHYPGKIFVEEVSDDETNQTVKDWRDKSFDKESLFKRVNLALQRAKELDLPLYCGEFGCIFPQVDKDSRNHWFYDVCSIFRENNIGYTVWDYKGGFKLFNPDRTPQDEELVDIVVNSNRKSH
ncbi:MAG: cellulase family glycosylhydrolase [Bacteroidales bacterium]|nr:cellulase family glycosylhydrolase [Bacteroidales bacterium]